MEFTKIRNNKIFIFGIPIALIFTLILFSYSKIFSKNVSQLAIPSIIDFVFIIPLIYFLLIRKTTIDKKTVVPFFIVGIIIASFIIPEGNQQLLVYIKKWVAPIVEITVLFIVILNIRKAVKGYKEQKNKSFDILTNVRNTCNTIFPKKAANFIAIEFTCFYYSFIHWKKTKLKENEFTYHENTGTQALFFTVIFLIFIETAAFHLLLSRWSTLAAWILTGISMYSAFQIFGFLRSLSKRPIMIKENILELRYGIMCESDIEIQNIDTVELTTKAFEPNDTTAYLSFLGSTEGHNMIIHLKKENTLIGLYGKKKKFKSVALFIDKKQEFKTALETKCLRNG